MNLYIKHKKREYIQIFIIFISLIEYCIHNMIKRTIGICHHRDGHEIISGYKIKLQNTLYLNMILLVNTSLKLIICDTITNGTKIQYSITTDYPGWLRSFYIHPLRANHYCMRFTHFH